MNQQLQTRTQTAVGLRSLAESPAYQNRIRELLQDRAPQFVASLVQLVNGSRQLQECEPNSVIAAAITAAALNLPIDKNLGFAHIVPYGGQAQFQISYRGLIQLALRTGQYSRMNAKAVNKDAFGGYDDVGDPVILWNNLDETKEEVGYVFAWKMVTGFTKVVYWPKEKVVAHAERYSQAYKAKKKDSPWFTNFRAMGLKTVVKDGLTHWGIMSVEMQQAIVSDQAVRVSVDAPPVYPDNEGEAPKAIGNKPKFVKTPAPTNVVDIPSETAAEEEHPELAPAASTVAPPETLPPQSTAPNAEESPELTTLRASLLTLGVTEAQVIALCQKKSISKGRNESLAAMDAKTLVNLNKVLTAPGSSFLKEVKEQPS